MLHAFIVNTRIQVAAVLAVIWVFYLLFHPSLRFFFMPLLSVAAVVAFDLLVTYIRKRRLFLPASSLVSGFLIGLIIAPEESVWVFLLAAALAVFSKQFIRAREHQHIFNPAAFGILVASVLTGAPVSWWAVSWSPWMIPLIMSVSYTLYRLKRLWLPLTFLLTYGIYVLSTQGVEGVMYLFLDGTVMLFAFVMLPEPITSIASGKWKYFFGPLIAVLTIFVGSRGLFGDLFLPVLLFGNLIGFFTKALLTAK